MGQCGIQMKPGSCFESFTVDDESVVKKSDACIRVKVTKGSPPQLSIGCAQPAMCLVSCLSVCLSVYHSIICTLDWLCRRRLRRDSAWSRVSRWR